VLRHRHATPAGGLPFLGILLAYACDAVACSGFIGFVSADSFNLVIAINPPVLVVPAAVVRTCRDSLPVTFQLVVQQPSDDLFLNEIHVRLVDGGGASGHAVSLASADMTRIVIPHDGAHSFDFRNVPLPCPPQAPVRLVARTTLMTPAGRTIEADANAPIQ
jgi:hypothetical protein